MNTHHRLGAWQDARRLVCAVYRLAAGLPRAERYIATPQLLRAAWSVHNNLAEGNAKLGRAEMRRFFDSALGSLAEVDAMVTTLGDLYPLDSEVRGEIERIRQSIAGKVFAILKARAR